MKKPLIFLGFLLIIFSKLSIAGTNFFFNIAQSGSNLNITTTIPNHNYPSAGIKITSPGTSIVSGCTPLANGYYQFAVDDKTPTQITLSSLTNNQIVTFVLCLNGKGPLSCQRYSNQNKLSPGQFAYVTNFARAQVTIIDIATNTVLNSVNVGNNPIGVAVNPNGLNAYVCNFSSNIVSILDTITNQVTGSPINASTVPAGVIFSSDGAMAYVTELISSTVNLIDTATNTITNTIAGFANPFPITILLNGTRLYVGNQGNNTVSVVDIGSNSIVDTIPVGLVPSGIASTPDGTKVYVTNGNDNTVCVISTASNTVISTIAVGNNPPGVAVSLNGSKVY